MIHQDVDMYAAKAQQSGSKMIKTFTHRYLWVQVIRGTVTVESTELNAGDGAGITDTESLSLKWTPVSEFILFDLPH